MMTSMNVIAAEAPLSSAGSAQLILAAVLAIATVVLLIVWAKFHPLLGLILGTAVLAAVAAVPPDDALASFILGSATTFGGVGLLIALGAMLGKLLADSGGANRIVDTIVDRVGPSATAVGDGRHRRDHRPADVLRDRGRDPGPDRRAGGPQDRASA